jgi:hypothetical protein
MAPVFTVALLYKVFTLLPFHRVTEGRGETLILMFRSCAHLGIDVVLRHHLSGGAQGPDPVQALLQAGPPDAVQPPLSEL